MGTMIALVIIPKERSLRFKVHEEVSGYVARIMAPFKGRDELTHPVWMAFPNETLTDYIWKLQWSVWGPEFSWAWAEKGPFSIQEGLQGKIATACAAIVTPGQGWLNIQAGLNKRNELEEKLDRNWKGDENFWKRTEEIQDKIIRDILSLYDM